MHFDLQGVVEHRRGRHSVGERAAGLSQRGRSWGDDPNPDNAAEPLSPHGPCCQQGCSHGQGSNTEG